MKLFDPKSMLMPLTSQNGTGFAYFNILLHITYYSKLKKNKFIIAIANDWDSCVMTVGCVALSLGAHQIGEKSGSLYIQFQNKESLSARVVPFANVLNDFLFLWMD